VLGIDNGELRPSWKTALDSTTPGAVAATGSAGTSLVFAHRDHLHQGVATFSQAGWPALYGDVELDEGNLISLVQTGQTIIINVDIHDLLDSTGHGDVEGVGPTVGDLIYGSSTPAWNNLAGNITTTKKFLTQTGDGVASAPPAWGTIADGDVPATHSGSAHHAQAHVILDSAAHSDTLTGTVVAGDIIYGNATPKWARLPKGTAAQVLTMNAGATAPEWATPAAGGGAVATDVIWDAKGDLAVGTGADTAVKLTAGSDNAVLQTLASEATGLIWRTTPRIGAIADTGGTTRIELTAAPDNIVLTGEVRITAAAAAATSQALDLTYTMTTAQTNHMGIRISPQLTLTGTAGFARGLYGQAVVSGPTAGTGTSLQGWGLDYNFVAQEIFSSVTNTWLTVGGIQASGLAQALGASSVVNVTNFHGLKTYLQLNALISGTVAVTNAYGVWVAAPINTSGTITTNKGVYVENLGGTGTTNVFGVDIAAQSGASAINVGLRNAGTTVFTPSTVQTLAAGTTILANATYIMINSSGAVTLTNNPVIADGQDGQILIIHNVDSADAITIPENNVQFAPTGSKVLGPGDSVTLIFSATLGDWYEIASANV